MFITVCKSHSVVKQPYSGPTLRSVGSKDFFLNLKEEINVLIPTEKLSILGYLYFFIENFNNAILLLK